MGAIYAIISKIPNHILSAPVSISRDGAERKTAKAPTNKLINNFTGVIRLVAINDKMKNVIADSKI